MLHTTLRHYVALNLIHPYIGARRAHRLLKKFGDIEGLFSAGEEQWRSVGLPERAIAQLAQPEWQKVDAVFSWLDAPNRHLLLYGNAAYPALLTHIADPPLLLYAEGEPALLSRPQLAMVGSRHPTPSGDETAYMLAAALAKLGFVIVSGMALGIDAAAHRGALSANGKTVAVMGTGLDLIYPSRHQALAEQITQTGCLLSEYPLGTQALGRHFPMRNRIISGLSRGVIVVEAALKSGSLITAKQALEQGREVFAVPGSIHSPTSRGCHWLLREGAKLVENIEDILSELDQSGDLFLPAATKTEEVIQVGLPDGDYAQVLAAVDFVPTSVDRIIERSGLTADVVCSMLLILELYNIVHITSGGQYCRSTGIMAAETRVNECGIV